MSIGLPAGAVLRRLELPAQTDAGDVTAPTPLVRRYAAIRNASVLG